MKRLVLVGLVAVAGCGTNPPDPFPEVTGAMRVACAPYDYSDLEIATLIQAVETLRDDLGLAEIQVIASLDDGCGLDANGVCCGWETNPDCFLCSMSVIDYVWR
ncbi:MAG: hypothetical protein IH988_01840 [Planctomycetes bacterium]|nr:hypothetical protein [Planctomycetota bacterium]